MTIEELLAANHIKVENTKAGTHYVTCPKVRPLARSRKSNALA